LSDESWPDGNEAIRKISSAGVVTTYAGFALAMKAQMAREANGLITPRALLRIEGNSYVADRNNHTIRKITPGGVVSTLAGLAGSQRY
jgi:hypothetical protein